MIIKDAELIIYNIDGKKMGMTKALEEGHAIFDISDLPKGLYFIKISNHNVVFLKKCVSGG